MGSCAAGACVSPLDAMAADRHLYSCAHTKETLATVTALHDAAMAGPSSGEQTGQGSLFFELFDTGSRDAGSGAMAAGSQVTEQDRHNGGAFSAQGASAWDAAASYALGDRSRSYGAASALSTRASVLAARMTFSNSGPPSPLSLDGKPRSPEDRVSNAPFARVQHGACVAAAAAAPASDLSAEQGGIGGNEDMAEEEMREGGGALEWRRVVAMLMSDTKHAVCAVHGGMCGQGGREEQQQHDETRNPPVYELTHREEARNRDEHDRPHYQHVQQPPQLLENEAAQCHHHVCHADPLASSPLKLVVPMPRFRCSAVVGTACINDAMGGVSSSNQAAHSQLHATRHLQTPRRQLQVTYSPLFSTPVALPLSYDQADFASDTDGATTSHLISPTAPHSPCGKADFSLSHSTPEPVATPESVATAPAGGQVSAWVANAGSPRAYANTQFAPQPSPLQPSPMLQPSPVLQPRCVPLGNSEPSPELLKLSLTDAGPHELHGAGKPAPGGWRSKSKRRDELTVASPRVQIASFGDGIASPSNQMVSPGGDVTSPGLQSPPTILLDDVIADSGRGAPKRRRGQCGSWEARADGASPSPRRAVVAEKERGAGTGSATPAPFEGPDWLHHLQSGKLQALPIMLRMETTKDRISLLRQLVAPTLTKGDTATVLGEVEQFVRAVYEKLKEITNGHEQHAAFPANENCGEWGAPVGCEAGNDFRMLEGAVGRRDGVGLAAKGVMLVTRRTAENFVKQATSSRKL
ncbi:hypothetical protein CLOP_g22296 [Closterium sp. NIES-67]|nr:hypothetical protein CLOP_g22296 [Closterium sp. NIES-67]